VVKAQVHAGGRGKAGGVKMVQSVSEALRAAGDLLGKRLVTFQSGPAGQPVNQVLIERASYLEKELYLAVMVDRECALPCVIFSEAGGMEIEEVAKEHPEKILKLYFNPRKPLLEKEALALVSKSSVSEEDKAAIASVISKLAKILVALDASLVEINPLGILKKGGVAIVDAKITFDPNALFKHSEIAVLRDMTQEDPREIEAKQFDLSYVGLEGTIGCMVNGAGLAMATMDLIKLHGGEPANFLDVGGGASVEKVTAAFKIILSDPRVKAVLVNIFGGIMKCDVVANGILKAVREVGARRAVPLPALVVRLEGTNVREGKAIIQNSDLKVVMADGLTDAAKKVVTMSANGHSR
jgi:succinyl-CoA synthetase beta subunit